MIDFQYLYKGLCGLANAHRASSMAGHLGAALVAGYFLGEDHHDLNEKVHRGVEKELDRVVGGEEAFWFNAKKAGITIAELFKVLPEEEPDADAIAKLAKALQRNIDQTRQSGHNVIFTSLVIRALGDHPDYATPSMIAGMQKLIATFDNEHAGRGYYGKERGWLNGDKVELPADDDIPLYKNQQEMAAAVIDELIATGSVRKQGFGGLWHVVNHAAALIEISRCGYEELTQQGLAAHHQHLRLWRSLPDVESELGAVLKAEHDPRTAEYWAGMLKRDEARLTHRIKTLYGYYTVEPLIDDAEKRKRGEDALLYLMA